MKKGFLLLSSMLLLGAGTCFAAARINENIQATKCYDIGIKYDGEIQTLYDGNGNVVYPLIYNGTTYLPVKAVGQLFDVPVNWEGETRTVLLGENSEWTKLTVENVNDLKSRWYPGTLNLTFNGTKYTTGHKISSNSSNNIANPMLSLNLGEKYSKLSFKIISEAYDVSVKDVKLNVNVKDVTTGATLYEGTMVPNSDSDITLNVTSYNNVLITVTDSYVGQWCNGSATYIVDLKAK